MGTTWRDAVSAGALVVVVIGYAVYLGGTSLVLLSSASAASAVVLVCGLGCTVLAAGDLKRRVCHVYLFALAFRDELLGTTTATKA